MVVKATKNLMEKCASRQMSRQEGEDQNSFLARITHLYLQEQNLEDLGELSRCRKLKILYAYDNKITKIPFCQTLANLTALYLQNNKILKMENLDPLLNLKKLHLGGNFIEKVEGLENLKNLEELYVEKQTLPSGESLKFNDSSLRAVQSSLKVLNVSKNQLTTLSNLKELTSLSKLLAKNNCVQKLEYVLQTVEHFNDLRHLELAGNPVSRLPYYRTTLIMNVKTLSILDGKEITEESKTFLQQMYVQRKKSSTSSWTGNFDILEKEQHTQVIPHHIPSASFPVRKYLPKIPKVVHRL
ncbi:protein phosphatase 1 regulatory subunit 42-like [Limulus polyphemus]|uniref:Protein phosphatase 1 regulatory subunit 42-like n=1 Tax=Limulus polyphemus TaxID=6850 RepID=A0ABM1SLZ8_LIMPO|nr:protein phosphatase 1 regulatory subunit 42-like [Limulus polyphemus]